jgi:hypothetical protein
MADSVSTIVAAVAGISGVALGAVLQHFFTSALEARRRQQELRSNSHVDLLRGMTELTYARRSDDPTRVTEARRQLADAKVRVAVYGDPSVVRALARFTREGENLSSPTALEAFTSLLEAMRRGSGKRSSAITAEEVSLVLIGPSEINALRDDKLLESHLNEKGGHVLIPLATWAARAAIVSAMADTLTIGGKAFEFFYTKRLQDPDLQQKALALQAAYSTYSDREVEAIKKRIEGCRDRFIAEGAGEGRKTCLCSVLQDVKDGNGGSIPVDDWKNTYDQLHCAA